MVKYLLMHVSSGKLIELCLAKQCRGNIKVLQTLFVGNSNILFIYSTLPYCMCCHNKLLQKGNTLPRIERPAPNIASHVRFGNLLVKLLFVSPTDFCKLVYVSSLPETTTENLIYSFHFPRLLSVDKLVFYSHSSYLIVLFYI